jgi:hypothetical protein
MSRTCAHCNFFHPMTVKVGQCRKSAPTTLVLPSPHPPGYTVNGGWPGTPHDGWCGEWKAKILLSSSAREKQEEKRDERTI